ncbi:hypothetical protein PYW07_004805 [Mythimna separata]|uniref:Multiple inositol polyphosphate phosphatase 1 n=1 Tax=Mythimna separata TaxID=271217 RepID=A0AAD7YYC6_MYTSE|nr:hypothetical protein PYW07_004805 [Mythimna separata]
MSKLLVLVLFVVYSEACYWNAPCTYQLFGSKTPYDTVRGDIRDYATPPNCEAVSIWTLNRHGNRNPGDSVTRGMKEVSLLRDEIVQSWDMGTSKLCAQDIEDFRNFKWNDTMDVATSYLTGTGYDELYGIGQRLREKYPHLLSGPADKFYFRPTNEQRTITSCVAFIHGLSDGTNLNVTMEQARQRDDVLRPYENCDRYQHEVKDGYALAYQLETYFNSPKYVAIQNAVQNRLGIETQLNASMVFSLYEMCRFYRTWSPDYRSPWCAAFTEEELPFIEYYEDIRHYYRNGYGSWVNENLGRLAMKDLYDSFMAFLEGSGRKISGHFTHDTMMEMVWCALGLYKEDAPLQATTMDPHRAWRSSYIGAFSSNIIAVLNSCDEVSSQPANQYYRVQIFINERETPLCPLEGCTMEEFQDKFKFFTDANLDFCSLSYEQNEHDPSTNNAPSVNAFWRYRP